MSDRRARDYARRLSRVAGKAGPEADAGQEPPGEEYQEPPPTPPPPAVVDQPPQARRGRRRTGKQVRVTVDLDRDIHRALRLFAVEAGVDATEVHRLLIRRLLRDPGFAESIRAELEE